FAPGLTVWATGAAKFDGGTEGFASEISAAGFGTPHSFNATGAIGDTGTLWMANGQGGNVIETLGYAVSGPAAFTAADTGWGETVFTGAHDVSLTNTFENGVTGSTSANLASLTFNDLAPGWYTVYVGGTNHASAGGAFALTVSAVPEAETWAMLLAGLGLVGWRLRRSPTASCEAAA
ncbi:MAG: FxDxF family PEP-CTERM protein, partial [Nitrosomonas sp.]